MVSGGLLAAVVAVEAALLLAGVAVLFGHAWWSDRRRRRYAARIRVARHLVRAAVTGDGARTAEAAAALRALPSPIALPLVIELTSALTGSGLARLRAVAAEAGLTRRARAWCHSRSGWRRLRGLRLLARLGGAADLVPGLLLDPHPAVRAAAAGAAPEVAQGRVAERLLEMLDDPDPLCRFAAKTALLRCGRAATQPVRRYLQGRDIEGGAAFVRGLVAALQVAAALPDPAFLPSALALPAHPDPAVRRAAADLLARLGGERAVGQLIALTTDMDAGVRAAATAGLGLLGHWPAAPALATALTDPSWDVRTAAALSLRRLGPPGRLFLRRGVESSDAFAADICRQVLELPEGAVHAMSG